MQARNDFRGVKIANSCPPISHLFFADDSLIFFKANLQEGVNLRNFLRRYEQASGQLINFEKSALSFSPNTPVVSIEEFKTLFTIPVVQGHSVYLALPKFSLLNKNMQFSYIKEKVLKRIRGWGQNLISVGGKEVLIKSVLQVIPTYAMSCFKMPISICEEIERGCAKFWWGMDNGKKQLHWKRWKDLFLPKQKGGMGFRRLVPFNQALLAKQIWRIICNPNSLLARVLKARYFKHMDIMQASLGNNLSFVWRSLIWGQELLDKGMYWRIGNGKTTRVVKDKWILGCQGTIKPIAYGLEDQRVSSLLVDGKWNEPFIVQHFDQNIVDQILKIPLLSSDEIDIFDVVIHLIERDDVLVDVAIDREQVVVAVVVGYYAGLANDRVTSDAVPVQVVLCGFMGTTFIEERLR
ncbi:uncharacterized protein [Henckelia pumila]|uniref:uncharacterized protein n=1 Tax=Henckelia pumila TaxID=405737 RepID=UPI003C6E2BF3